MFIRRISVCALLKSITGASNSMQNKHDLRPRTKIWPFRWLMILSLVSEIAPSLRGQPTWTQIENQTNQTTEASGIYFKMDGTLSSTPKTDVTAFPTMHIPASNSWTSDTTCSSAPSYWVPSVPPSRPPHERIVSNLGPSVGSYKGVGFYGSFGGGTLGSGGGNVNEAVYFHEQPCYFGGREYGFSYDAGSDNLIYYWSTNSNCTTSGTNCTTPTGFNSGDEVSGPPSGAATEPLTGFSTSGTKCTTSSPCFFEMWPVASGTTCYFAIEIIGPGPSYTRQWPTTGSGAYHTATVDTYTPTVTTPDPHFCTNILSESGYITATAQYTPTLSSIPSTVELNLDLQSTFTSGVFVGK